MDYPIIKASYPNWKENRTKFSAMLDKAHLKFDSDQLLGTDYFYEKPRGDIISPVAHEQPYFEEWRELIEPFVSTLLPTLLATWHVKPNEFKLAPAEEWSLWGQRYQPSGVHTAHNHSYGCISACHYIEFDPAVHEATNFYPPVPNFITGNSEAYIPDVEGGDILFFPSSLLHSSGVNRSDKVRGILAFNITATNR